MKTIRNVLGVGLAALTIAGANCSAEEKGNAQGKRAVVVIQSRSDSHVTGKGTFEEENGKVTLKLEIEGAEPGTHAIHLHEKGDCTAPDAASAGGHWNPTHENHGKWATSPFHH